MKFRITALVQGGNTFLDSKNIVFTVDADEYAGELPVDNAIMFLNSILAKDTVIKSVKAER